LIYCDPPYSPLDQRSNFSSYTNNKFGEKEHVVLAGLAMDSMKRGITVIISNHDTPFTRLHYQKGIIKSFSVMRSISCLSQKRLPAQELLAIFKPRKSR